MNSSERKQLLNLRIESISMKINLCLIWTFVNYRGWRQELRTSLLESKAELINVTEKEKYEFTTLQDINTVCTFDLFATIKMHETSFLLNYQYNFRLKKKGNYNIG